MVYCALLAGPAEAQLVGVGQLERLMIECTIAARCCTHNGAKVRAAAVLVVAVTRGARHIQSHRADGFIALPPSFRPLSQDNSESRK